MTQAIERAQPNGLTLDMVSEMTGFDLAEIALIRHKMATSAGQEVSLRDIALFSRASKQLGLDPLLNQVHWISRGGKGVLQVGIDGFRAIADRSGVYAGSELPTYRGCIRQDYRDRDGEGALDVPEKATVVVWKVVAGHKCAFTGEARWVEFYPGNKEGFMWRKMPHHMLGKAAEAQALRKAFPAQLGTIVYADDGAVDGEYPDAGREQSWEQQPPAQIVEQPRLSERYKQIFGSEETGSAYDLPQTRAAPSVSPTSARAQPGRAASDSQSEVAPPEGRSDRLITDKRDPLWLEWLEMERTARKAGVEFDTSDVKLGCTESSLRASIGTLREAIAAAAPEQPEFEV